jgi:uncharacterized protein related to proFAR isomerase
MQPRITRLVVWIYAVVSFAAGFITTSLPLIERIIASGGVTALDEVKAFKKTRVSGVIIGVALYQNIFTLEEAIAC